MDMKSFQIIASDKYNSLRKVDLFLKRGFQVIVFSIPFEVAYLVIFVNFVFKSARQLFTS